MAFNFQKIPKFCISLKRNRDRRKKLRKEFKKAGLRIANSIHAPACAVQFFPGVDKSIAKIPELLPKTKTPGVYGCMASHLKIIQLAEQKRLPAICIFEDDVIFCDDFKQRIKYIENLPIKWDIFLLGGHWETRSMGGCAKPTKYKNIYHTIHAGGTYAYIIKRNVYPFILRNCNYFFGMDEFYSTYVYSRFRTLAMTPFPVGTYANKSDITGSYGKYENVDWFYIQSKIDLKKQYKFYLREYGSRENGIDVYNKSGGGVYIDLVAKRKAEHDAKREEWVRRTQ